LPLPILNFDKKVGAIGNTFLSFAKHFEFWERNICGRKLPSRASLIGQCFKFPARKQLGLAEIFWKFNFEIFVIRISKKISEI